VGDEVSTRIAAVQAAPAFLDREGTIDRVATLTAKAALQGATLVAFPEAFVPTYPDWVWRTAAWRDGALYEALAREAITVPSAATDRLGGIARTADAWLAVGINERAGGTLYNTVLYLAPDGAVAGTHRKLVPTGGERTVWGRGDGSTLPVLDTPVGRVGGLICWENYMPLARAALWAQGVDVLLAPTWDTSDVWQSTIRHIAREGRAYVVGVNSWLRGSDVPDSVREREGLWGGPEDTMSRGGTVIVDPFGEPLAGPLYDEEGILVSDVDPAVLRAARREFDPVGHYARPDVFRLSVDIQPRPAASFG
jgi:nitrilase